MEKTEKKGIFSRFYAWLSGLSLKGLLSAVFVAFIIVIILLSVSYLPSVISRISSSLSAALYSIFVPADKATMVADRKILNSGEDFVVNFNQGGSTAGLFAISYACNPDLELLSVETSGLKRINCEDPYYLLENAKSVTVRPITSDSVVRLTLEGFFENNDTEKIEKVGVVRITIKNDTTDLVSAPIIGVPRNSAISATNTDSVTTNTVTPTYNYNSTGYAIPSQPVYYGKPDLAVRMLQTGLLVTGNNIIPRTQFSYSDMVGIKFEVRNDGDGNTGPWYFTASLPSVSTPVYNSNIQISLRPGESIIFTLGFSNLTRQYSSSIVVNVDPQNLVNESIEYNNTATSVIYNVNYNGNYNDNNGCYVNGFFTYNCSGNDYYDNDYLTVSCYASPNDPETGDRVRWHAIVSGGDGDYDFDWTGTNSLNSSSQNPTKTYSSRGTKRATVTVTDSDDNEATATCSVFVD